MCRLFPCIPIFKGFFLLKVKKECVYVIMFKMALSLFKIYVLVVKKGISGLVSQVVAKPSALKNTFNTLLLEVLKRTKS